MIVIVCSALIVKDDKVLLVQENKMDKLGLPGGKLESGESLKECLTRELKEELGADIMVGQLVMVSEKPFTREGNTVLRYIYRAEITGMAEDREMEYDFFDQTQVKQIAADDKLRGKDVEALLRTYFTAELTPLPEPTLFR